MTKANSALKSEVKINHGIELYGYLLTRNLRKKAVLYDFEANYISKNNTLKDYGLTEKLLKKENLSLSKKEKKIKLL